MARAKLAELFPARDAAARRFALRRAAGDILGPAGVALGSSFFAVGVLFSESGFAWWQSVLSTLTNFALPGQLSAAEVYAQGGGLAAIFAIVALVNFRLAPMTASLLPLVGHRRRWPWLCHFIAVTSWVCFMRARNDVPPPERLAYFTALGFGLWALATVATISGHLAAGVLPPFAVACLLFLNPSYFLCMVASGIASRESARAAFFGGMVFLPAEAAAPEWGLIAAGIVGGAAAFGWSEVLEKDKNNSGGIDSDGINSEGIDSDKNNSGGAESDSRGSFSDSRESFRKEESSEVK